MPGDMRRLEMGILAIGALSILLVLSQWAGGVFAVEFGSDRIVNVAWLLFELGAMVIGVGLTVSPYILIGRLSKLIPRDKKARLIQYLALLVTLGTVTSALWLYLHYLSTMGSDPEFPSPLIFAVLPVYIFICAGAVYGLVVLLGRIVQRRVRRKGV